MDERSNLTIPESDQSPGDVDHAQASAALDGLLGRLDLPTAAAERVDVGEVWTSGELTLPATSAADHLRAALDHSRSEHAGGGTIAATEVKQSRRWLPLVEAAVIILAVLGIVAFWWLWW